MMQALWRGLVIVAGLGVIAAATLANIEHAGGHGSKDAWLIVTIAVLLALGMGYAAIAWQEGRRAGALALAFCLLCGEAYWLAVNLEREIAAREEAAAPLLAQQAQRAAAEKRLAEAETAKRTADAAALTEAAKPGCRANCAQLLSEAKAQAGAELEAARVALAGLPLIRSGTPLPERLGLASWVWDLILAGLRSMAVMGGSIAVALAIHPREKRRESETTRHKALEPAPEPKAAPQAMPVVAAAPIQPEPVQTAEIIPLLSAPKPPATDKERRQHVTAFLKAVLRPDPRGVTSLRRLHGTYLDWCHGHEVEPLPPADLGRELRAIVEAIGLEVEQEGRDVVVKGAALGRA